MKATGGTLFKRHISALEPPWRYIISPPFTGRWLADDDLVLGYVSESDAFAYPIKMLDLHEIVHDVIDGVPVLVTYCPLCGSGVVYNRELDGDTLIFGNTSALYESDMVMYDHETGSYWFQVMGEAIVGPLTGRRLKPLASRTTTWEEWKEAPPGHEGAKLGSRAPARRSRRHMNGTRLPDISEMLNRRPVRLSRQPGQARRAG